MRPASRLMALLACTDLFEMLLKLVAFGCEGYWSEPFNRFDGIVVTLSCVDVVTSYLHIDIGVDAQVLRAFRLLRVFKLARSWSSLYLVIRSVLATFANLRDLFLVLVLLLFVFALLAMQLFGCSGTGGHCELQLERNLYDSIEHAMITVFIVVTGENWNNMWRETHTLGMWTGLYYAVVVAVGDYIVLNLVIAVVIGGVVEAEDKEQARNRSKGGGTEEVESSDHEEEEQATGCCSCSCEAERSLGLFAADGFVRKLCGWIIHAKIPGTPISLDTLIIGSVVVTSFLVAMDGSCAVAAPMAPWLFKYLYWTLIMSFVDIGCRVVTDGLLFLPNAYLRNGWQQMDALISVLCIYELVGHGSASGLVLRSIHVLRPLRLIARLPGLRQVVLLLVNIMPRVVNILLVYSLFMVVFAILGVQIFKGTFGYCPDDDAAADLEACKGGGHVWESAPTAGSFDNIFSSALLLFEISSLEGWQSAMYMGIDAVGVNQASVTDHNMWASIYFIAWVILGAFVVLNVFVGVLIDTFAKMNTQQRFGGIFTSEQQQQWVETLETMTSVRPERRLLTPRGAARGCAFKLATHRRFDHFILLVILFNTLLMALDASDLPESLHDSLDMANDACTIIFTFEALLKLYGLGLGNYFSEGWNVFDFSVVAVALAEVAFEAAAGSLVKGSLLRIARLARAARVLRTVRAVRASRSIRHLLTTLLYSIFPLGNILGVFVIITFIYAVLGMELFGHVKWGDYINDEANFCRFSSAMLTMFRCATGEDWNGIMHDAMVTPGRGCDPALGDCGSVVAVPFFVSYVILTSFIVLKMMVALIIENFKLSMREDSRYVTPYHRDKFVEAWAEFDPDGTGRVLVSMLPPLIRRLKPPLGLNPKLFRGATIRDRDVTNFILALDIDVQRRPVNSASDGQLCVRFHDLLLALTTRALEVEEKGKGMSSGSSDMGSPVPVRAFPRRAPSESTEHLSNAPNGAGPETASPSSALPVAGNPTEPARLETLGSIHSLFKAKAREMRKTLEGRREGPVEPMSERRSSAVGALTLEYATYVIQNRWRRKLLRKKEKLFCSHGSSGDQRIAHRRL